MMDIAQKEKAIKKQKKASKIVLNVSTVAGVSLGLFLLYFIIPFIHEDDSTQKMQNLLALYGLVFLAYVGVMVGVYVFLRPYIFFFSGFAKFIFLPTVAILFAYDIYKLITG
jgi:hypothetical protein